MQDKLRDALRFSTGDETVDTLARDSIRAGIVGTDPELLDIFEQEAGPEQAEVDLHLDGPGVDGHSTNAKRFAEFISGVSDAVKETAKHRAGKGRYAAGLLIEGATPGSVRVVLKAPTPTIARAQEVDPETFASSIESDALRSIAAILTHASDPDPNSPLVAELAELPLGARVGLKRAIKSSRKAGWTVEGQMRQRRIGLREVRLSTDGATRLSLELDSRIDRKTKETVIGKIDGYRRSLGTVYFIPDGGKVFTAGVLDSEIVPAVTDILTDPEAEVKAVFNVVESQMPGGKGQIRKSRTLIGIQRTGVGEQAPLFVEPSP